MPDILLEATINASPEKIYHAISEQDQIRQWWTQQATAQPKVGTTSEFGFYGGQVLMHIAVSEMQPNRHIEWKPIDGVPDWPGTRITWDLTPVEGGTKLLFGHRDYASAEGSLPMTGFNWAWYMISLKKYMETGRGDPHTGAPNT